MCNFCRWKRRGNALPQQPGKNKRQTTRIKPRTKTKKASPAPAKKSKKVVTSLIKSTSPSEADVLADLPSTSVRTIKIPGSSLEPVEDSGIFKWKQFREKVESSMKGIKKKLTQLGSNKKDKKRSRSPNVVSVEEDSESDKIEDDDYCDHCSRDNRSPQHSQHSGYENKSPHPRRSPSPHQSPKTKEKRKTTEVVDRRGDGDDRRSKVPTPTTKSPSRHSPKKTPLSSLMKTPSTVAVQSKLHPSITPTSPTKKEGNGQNVQPPVQQFTAMNSDSAKSNSSRSDWEGKYYSNIASDTSQSSG